jgi:hypothetical protein
MIKKFEDYTNGYGFLLPSESGALGHIPKAVEGGEEPKVKTFKEFDGEYRKGSDKFGGLVGDLMMFLRMFKDDTQKDTIKFKIDEFQKKSNIDIEKIQQLLDADHNLLSFDIKIDKDYIIFTNLNNVYKTRFVWGENNTY